MMKKISEMDKSHLKIIRENINMFMQECADKYDCYGELLDIAPQDHEGASPFFKKSNISTLDIDSESNADIIADICTNNSDKISDNTFDIVVCTEVLEHTLNPFNAIDEIHRILKPKGKLLLTVPFNLRIHGPLPDCWRFTEHGIKALLKDYKIIELRETETESRWLMPIHYQVIAQKF